MAEDRYLSPAALAEYSGLSQRTVWRLLVDPTDPVPSALVGRRRLIRRSEFDAWVAGKKQARDRSQEFLNQAVAGALQRAKKGA